MEMTIDELVETAQKYSCMIVTKDMWNTALGSVHKYQKIEQIVGEKGMPEWSYQRFMEIASIVRGYEDGNDT